MKRTRRWSVASVGLAFLMIVTTSAVFADSLTNELTAGAPDVPLENLNLAQSGPAESVDVWLVAQNDGDPSCNFDVAGDYADFSVTSSDTSKATVSPSSIHLTACGSGAAVAITVTPVAQGTTEIQFANTASQGGGVYNGNTANFKVWVDNAPAVSSTVPTDLATGVAATTNLTINFSEAVNITNLTGWISIECDLTIATADGGDGVTTGSGTSAITFNPTVDFVAGDECLVEIVRNHVSDVDTVDGFDNPLGPGNYTFSFTVAGAGPVNNPPDADAGGDYNGTEGTGIPLDGTGSSDPDNDTLTYSWTVDDSGINDSGTCSFDDATSATPDLTCTDDGTAVVTLGVDDGNGGTDSDTANVTVSNADPVVETPTWLDASIDCGDTATLQNISFTDDGTNDTWVLDIDWGDGDSDSPAVTAQGDQSDQTHTYDDPGTYTASVTVTDDEGGSDSEDAADLTVAQTYTVDFLAPMDDSTPAQLIANTFKNGRVVPIKVTILDDCTDSYVTGTTGEVVTIKVKTASFVASPGATDTVETYSDAGASSGNTTSFRWTADLTVAGGGFWMFNLDSSGKGFGLSTNVQYEVHAVVDGACQNDTYAIIKPTK